jgi:arylformamidase
VSASGAAVDDGWLDVTVPIRDGMVHWPGDPAVHVTRVKDLEHGHPATVTHLDLGVHTGTHVDAPVHFIAGAPGIHELPLGSLLGPARVVALPNARTITAQAIEEAAPAAGERLLVRTDNSTRCWRDDRFVPDYTYLSLGGARALAAHRVATVGVDYLSIGGGDDGPAIHRALLESRICVIEGLNLSQIAPGLYDLICLPLRIHDADGAPARVLLRPCWEHL